MADGKRTVCGRAKVVRSVWLKGGDFSTPAGIGPAKYVVSQIVTPIVTNVGSLYKSYYSFGFPILLS